MVTTRSLGIRWVRRLPLGIALATVLALPILYANGEWLAARLTERTLALWIERGQRVPRLVWQKPARASSMTEKARNVSAQSAEGTATALYMLPVESAVTQVVQTPMGWVAVTFDDGAFVLSEGPAQPLPLGNRVNEVQVHRGSVWAATDEGLWSVRFEGAPTRVAEGAFTSLASWRGSLWALSRAGVNRVGAKGLRTWGKAFGFDADAPSVMRACGEALCVCATNGVFVFDGGAFTRRSAAAAHLPNDFATDIASDSAGTWVGTFDGGLARWTSTQVERWTPPAGLLDGRVQPRALVTAPFGAVFGTPTGLYTVRDDTLLEWRLQGHRVAGVSAVARGDDGSFFIGLKGRVLQVELKQEPRI
jgi:hypothetical protein